MRLFWKEPEGNRSSSRYGDGRTGFTLAEILVAIGLMAVTVIFSALAISQSRKALLHARMVQACSIYAAGLIEEVRAAPPARGELPKKDIDGTYAIGSKDSHVTRNITLIDSHDAYTFEHVVVEIDWQGCPKPVVLTRDFLKKE